MAAKQLIADASTLQLPPCWIARYPKGTRAPDSTIAGYWYLHGLPSSEYIAMWREAYVGFANAEAASVRFDRVELETALGDIRPDLIGYCGGRRLLIEIAVSHKVDAAKLTKIRALGLPAIEITLPQDGDMLDWDKLRERIFDSTSYTRWLYHPKLEALVDAALERATGEKAVAERRRREREAFYRDNYAPTHEVRFFLGNCRSNSKVYLRLCPSHVSISLWPEQSDEVMRIVKEALAVAPDKLYNQRRQQWTIPTELPRFLVLAKALREQGFFPDRIKAPPVDELALFAALGFVLQ
ncbi:hypothetical protein AWB61_01245 [Chromobacterium sp. F49]|uniref:hypothetical protein n=1 Tax=Chromobacterium subtsugae TaxID=251747 RepID=UPI0005BE815C|nr:hypothetical protein Cv017_15740 [Chromobacterium subtsugae]KZE85694.1 hypothetical protein AWB61_01245 [Chromobacterium sp. F49]